MFVRLVDRQCYGGDVSRKKKLLQKQAKGKKRMKALGKVIVPQEAFQVQLHFPSRILGFNFSQRDRETSEVGFVHGGAWAGRVLWVLCLCRVIQWRRHGQAKSTFVCVFVYVGSQVCLSLKGGKGGGGGE